MKPRPAAQISVEESKTVLLGFIERSLTGEEPIRGGIPEAIYRLRTKLGNRAALARAVEVSGQTIAQMESGAIKYGSPDLLSRLAIQARRYGMPVTGAFFDTTALIVKHGQRGPRGKLL